MSSPYGDNYIGRHLNRSRAEVADFYRAVQFEGVLYRPDVLLGRFRSLGRRQVRVEVWTGNSIGIVERYLLTEGRPPAPRPGELYVLAVGVSAFPGLPLKRQLRFAARDASGLARFFQHDGLFTYGLLRGLGGSAADRDRDRAVTLN
jgi:hypothetical protein